MNEFIMIFIRTLFFYFFIFIVYRIMGKREVGQLGIIDLIVSISIAELGIISIENYNNNIFKSIIPILILLFLQMSLSYLSLKFPRFRLLLDGSPSVIVKSGQINYKEMVKQKYNLDDLLLQIRSKGYRSIEEVEYAILENNGSLSVFAYSKGNKKTPFPLPIILDGSIQFDTLKDINKDKKWLLKILNNKNIMLEDVFYAFFKDKSIYIIKNDELS
ncbi:MAG: DUF421 domain-containing protein [Bacilli bacterium]|nr:DUF421 domain-containing protein [Bacilli bacterium]